VRLLLAGALLSVAICLAQQGPSATDGYTPQMMAPGTPEGSYDLSGFDSVNYGNGTVSFHFPLVKVGGRGKLSVPLQWTSNATWNTQAHPVYGTSSSGPPPIIAWNYDVYHGKFRQDYATDYGGGHIYARTAAYNCYQNPQNNAQYNYDRALTRLTFVQADGTETMLVDRQSGGVAYSKQNFQAQPYSRGMSFSRSTAPARSLHRPTRSRIPARVSVLRTPL
jgi:hypothetical protein